MYQSTNFTLIVVIMSITSLIFARLVLNKKIQVNKIKFIIIFTVSMILYGLSVRYLTGTLKTLVNCIIHITMFKYLFDIKIGKSILLTFLYVVLLMIPDTLELVIITKILGISKEFCYNEFAGSFLSNLIIAISLISITYIFKKTLNKVINYKLDENKKIIFLSILTLIITLIFFYNAFSNMVINEGFFISIIMIVSFLTILFSLYKQKIENTDLVNKYEKLLDYMKKYESEIELQRMLRHETKNQLLTIKSKVVDGMDTKTILKYVEEVLHDNKQIFNQEKYAKYQYLPPNGLKALFYFKTEEAEEKGVNVAINVSTKIENSFLSKLSEAKFNDLGKVIGVYLDNAIEASMISDKKNLGIEIYMVGNDIQMIISNTYIGKIDTGKLGKETFSTKGKTRGHGLLLVNSILAKNKSIKAKREINSDLYIQKIIIKESIVK